MIRTALAATVLVAALVGTASATAQPTLRVSPARPAHGAAVTIRGQRWPVIEFCSRTVRLWVGAYRLATLTVSTDGSFRYTWRPTANAAHGRRRVRATMRCESGKDGSSFWTSTTTYVTLS
jgi:hypothetical protein